MLGKILRRGAQAKNLLDNDIFRTAIKDVEDNLLKELTLTKAKDTETREQIYFAIRSLHDVVARLSGYIQNSQFERQRLNAERKKEEAKSKK